jgi:hypothetical protein
MPDRLLREGMETYAKEALPKILAAASIAAQPELARHVTTGLIHFGIAAIRNE